MKAAVLALALSFSLAAQQPSNPIRLDPKNPHYFLFHDKPIALVTSGEHYGSVLNPDFNFHKDEYQASSGIAISCL